MPKQKMKEDTTHARVFLSTKEKIRELKGELSEPEFIEQLVMRV